MRPEVRNSSAHPTDAIFGSPRRARRIDVMATHTTRKVATADPRMMKPAVVLMFMAGKRRCSTLYCKWRRQAEQQAASASFQVFGGGAWPSKRGMRSEMHAQLGASAVQIVISGGATSGSSSAPTRTPTM